MLQMSNYLAEVSAFRASINPSTVLLSIKVTPVSTNAGSGEKEFCDQLVVSDFGG